MRCSNCGMKIPVKGNVCPFCHDDKSMDKAARANRLREEARKRFGFLIFMLGGLIVVFILVYYYGMK